MRTEKGVVIVAYKRIRGSRRFLILKRKKNWEGWELPKGHLEEDDYTETVRIELNEEAGIDSDEILDIRDMDEDLEWSFEDDDEKVNRIYRGFIVELDGEASVDTSGNPCDEHETGFFMKQKDVESLLTYDNQKEMFSEAVTSLKQHS